MLDNYCSSCMIIVTIIGDFKGGQLGEPWPPGEKLVVENLDEMLTYALALLNKVFLAHNHVNLDLF